MITGTKSSLYVEDFFEFSDKLSGPAQAWSLNTARLHCSSIPLTSCTTHQSLWNLADSANIADSLQIDMLI